MKLSGKQLRGVRLSRFLRQQELADRAGTTEATVNRLEQNLQRAQLSLIRKLAAALGIEPAELVEQERAGDETARSDSSPVCRDDLDRG